MRTQPIHGFDEPNEKMSKPLLNKVFYRLAGAEGVLSRNLAKKGSSDWSREAMKFHKAWQESLEENLSDLGLLDKLKRYDHHLPTLRRRLFRQRLRAGADRDPRWLRFGLADPCAWARAIASVVFTNWNTRIRWEPFTRVSPPPWTSSRAGMKARSSGLAAYGDPEILLDLVLEPFSPGAGQLPHPREQQHLLLAIPVDAVSQDRRCGGLSASARDRGHQLRSALCETDGHRYGRSRRRRGRQRQAESADLRDSRSESHLHLPEHGRRRLRHWRGFLAVPRGIEGPGAVSRRSISVRTTPTTPSAQQLRAAGLPFEHDPADRAGDRQAHSRRQGRRAFQRPHGVRPASARQSLDSCTTRPSRR